MTSARRCELVELRHVAETRGYLNVAQLGDGLPFAVKRFYVIGDVPDGVVRGEHGHHVLEQFLVALRGRVRVELQGRGRRRTVTLERNTQGLFIPAGIYSTQQFFEDAQLLVLASGEYDPAGYLHDPQVAHGDVGDG